MKLLSRLALMGLLSLIVGTGYLFWQESQKVLSTEPTAWFQEQTGDCAVVLTGGPSRVREGFDLLAQGRIRKLIISGVFPGAELREIFPEWPFYGPISEEDVVLEKRSGSTFGNARQSLPLVEALKCRNIILVTSRLHMYRSERIFKSVFPSEIEIIPRAIVAGSLKPSFIDLSLESFKSLFYAIWAY